MRSLVQWDVPRTKPHLLAKDLVTSLCQPQELRCGSASVIGNAGWIDQPLCTLVTGNIINSVWDLLIALDRNSKQPNLEPHF